MPTINNILSSEHANNGTIRLYAEGIFYKAYEYSAYLFTTEIRKYKLKRKYYKVTGCDVVSTGFPMSALATIPLPEGITVDKSEAGVRLIHLQKPVDKEVFARWKSEVPLSVAQPSLPAAPPADGCTVLEKLSQFNLEEATPMACMLFLSELRKELREKQISINPKTE